MLLAILFLVSSLALGFIVSRRLFADHSWLFAIPLGTIFGTWAVFLSSLLLGFTETSIAVASIILIIPAVLDLRNKKLVFSAKAFSTPTAIFFVVSFAAFLLLSTALLHFDSDGNLVGNGTDLGFYLAISSSIAHGNFPPQYPIAAGEPLSYYYFFVFV